MKQDNRRALPKYLLTILLCGLLGGVLGFFTGVAGAAGVAETVRQALDRLLAAVRPLGHRGERGDPAGSGLVPVRCRQTASATAWDGEDEDTMDDVEQQLSWALLLTRADDRAGLFLFRRLYHLRAGSCRICSSFWRLWRCWSVLQQKIVDLERRINPEKRGSVYDMKFQKTWMDSCDEAERAQIGQACYTGLHGWGTRSAPSCGWPC